MPALDACSGQRVSVQMILPCLSLVDVSVIGKRFAYAYRDLLTALAGDPNGRETGKILDRKSVV